MIHHWGGDGVTVMLHGSEWGGTEDSKMYVLPGAPSWLGPALVIATTDPLYSCLKRRYYCHSPPLISIV